MDTVQIFKDTLYFLAILNPASKLLFLSSYNPPLTGRQNFELSWKSSLTACLILVAFTFIGTILLADVFRIQMYALRVSGGLILFFTGWQAVRNGKFTNDGLAKGMDLTEVSIIPLAAPLITGPGTITIAITMASEHGSFHSLAVVVIACLVNFLLMTATPLINRALVALHVVGPLIRITGLIVATVAIQMMLTGLSEWFASALPR
ncbi:MAG: MarC family protein [Victivallales bacterium]|nr:MarC family protein [Victivallales bacterium]